MNIFNPAIRSYIQNRVEPQDFIEYMQLQNRYWTVYTNTGVLDTVELISFANRLPRSVVDAYVGYMKENV